VRAVRELIEEKAEEPPIPDDLRAYTVLQAAEMLGLSVVYLRVMLKRCDIRSVKAGRRVLIPAIAIREFLSPPRPLA
jgi:excisionase family DNA binding protein